MQHVFGKWVGILSIATALAGVEQASAGGRRDSYTNKVISEVRAGPADYHKVYGNISQTTVTIEDFFLRTNDGNVIKVPTNIMTIDLQNLNGFTKGLVIDLRRVNFPRGVTELDVVEIETRVVAVKGREPFILWNRAGGTPYDGGKCMLKVPKFLNFYKPFGANDAVFKMVKDVYHVKVDYSALNAIQLDIVTQKIQKVDCNGCWSWFKHGDDEECRPIGRPQVKKVMRCELANRRHSMVGIVLAAVDSP